MVNRVLVMDQLILQQCAFCLILRGQLAIVLFWWDIGFDRLPVTMDTIQQVQSHLLAHQYESLIQKSQRAAR